MSPAVLCGMALFIAGMAILVVTGVVIMVRAFKVSLGWGLAYLLLPLANLFFIIRYWREVRGPMLYSFAGLGVVALGFGCFLLDPAFRNDFLAQRARYAEARALFEKKPGAPDATALHAERRQRARELFAGLKNWQTQLEAARPPAEASEAAKAAFEAEHANYRALLEEYNTLAKALREEATASHTAPSERR